MGCSTLSDSIREHAEAKQAQQEAVKAAVVTEARPSMPPMPAFVERCVRDGLAKGKSKGKDNNKPPDSADKKVLALLQSEEERRKCSGAILAWYKKLQEAQKVAAK